MLPSNIITVNVISSNVSEELETHNNETVFTPSALQWEGLTELYKYWRWLTLPAGKMRLAGADAWSNIQPHPASPAEREDKPFSSKAAELGHGACIPHAYRELLLPPSRPRTPRAGSGWFADGHPVPGTWDPAEGEGQRCCLCLQ